MRNEDVVALLGGLGNQLFSGRLRPPARDANWSRGPLRPLDPSDVEPDVLAVPSIGDEVRVPLLPGTRRSPTPDGRVAPLGRAIRKLRGPGRIISDYSGPGPESPSTSAAAWWFGYWQRLEHAVPLAERLAAALERGDVRQHDELVGVHVRRTDMLTTGTVVPEVWFTEALAQLDLDPSSAPIRVCSDDPEWCRRELRLGMPFEVAPDAPAVQDMLDISRCRALLISRSTFPGGRPGSHPSEGRASPSRRPGGPEPPGSTASRCRPSGSRSSSIPARSSDPLPYRPR